MFSHAFSLFLNILEGFLVFFIRVFTVFKRFGMVFVVFRRFFTVFKRFSKVFGDFRRFLLVDFNR